MRSTAHLRSSIQWLTPLLLTALCLTGCAKPGESGLLPGYDPSRLLGEETSADLTADASLVQFAAGTKRFAVIEDGAVARVLEMKVTAADDGAWRTEFEGERAAVMRVDDGRLLLLETTDYPNNAVTTFDPPVPLIDADISVDQEIKTKHKVIVHSLKDPSTIVDRGTGEQTLVRKADQDLVLPDRKTHRAVQLLRTLKLDLGRADVDDVITAWYVPKIGLAAERSKEQVKVFGPMGWTHERLMAVVP